MAPSRIAPSVVPSWSSLMCSSSAMCLSADVPIERSYDSKKRASETMPSSRSSRSPTGGIRPRKGGIHQGRFTGCATPAGASRRRLAAPRARRRSCGAGGRALPGAGRRRRSADRGARARPRQRGLHGERRVGGDGIRGVERDRHQVLGQDDRVHEPDRAGVLGGDGPRRQEERLRMDPRHLARQQHRRVARRVEPARDLFERERRVGHGEADVGRQQQIEADRASSGRSPPRRSACRRRSRPGSRSTRRAGRRTSRRRCARRARTAARPGSWSSCPCRSRRRDRRRRSARCSGRRRRRARSATRRRAREWSADRGCSPARDDRW